MKTHGIKLFAFIFLSFNFTFAQDLIMNLEGGGEVELNKNNTPCLNETQRAEIQSILKENVKQLEQEGKLMPVNKQGGHPLFDWPVIKAPGVDYESVWAISGYVDENPAYPDQITDYNCGTRSYDTSNGYNHQGIDVFTWPFWWYQMDYDQSQVIAGAAGQIVGKFDGNYDRSCGFNNNMWNAIYVQHGDGSTAWYGHMKSGSLTSKGIGDNVAQGEFLGIIGSSGNSTGPHLHFEVYDNANQLIDPNFGPCNTMNPDTWWQNQKPYLNTYINRIATHSTPPVFPTCPNTETLNLSNQFFAGDNFYLAIYLKDQMAGTQVSLLTRRPDNSIANSWGSNLTDDYYASWWYWSSTVPSGYDGTWTFEVSYQGQTVIHPYEVGILGLEDSKISSTKVYPNPLQNTLFIESEANIVSADIRDVLGRSVSEVKDTSSSVTKMDVSFLSKGMYFITLVSDENQSKTIKLIKE